MRVRSFLRRRQAETPRLTIRRHTPWPWRLGPLLLAAVFGAGVALLSGSGRGSPANANTPDVEAAAPAVTDAALPVSPDSICPPTVSAASPPSGTATATDGVPTAAQKADGAMLDRLLAQMKSVETENGRLKTDLAYLEQLLPARAGEGPVAIRNFEVRPDAMPDQLRYRALLTLGGRGSREFVGNMQFVWTAVIDGRTTTSTWPRDGEGGDALKLAFRRLQRVEGTFPIAAGAVVKSVQIRVMERGTVRAQQLAAL